MATPTARAIQRAQALQRLTVAAEGLAAALNVAPPDIPTHHRDAAHLPTVQMETIADFLEAAAVAVTGESAADDAPAEAAAEPEAVAPARKARGKKATG